MARLRGWMRDHPARRDLAVAAFWLVCGLGLWFAGAYPMWGAADVFGAPPWVFLLTLAGMVALATQRSRMPLTVLALGGVIATVDVLCGGSVGVMLVVTDVVYVAVCYSSDRAVAALVRGFGATLVAVAVVCVLAYPVSPDLVIVAVQLTLIVIVAGLWGWNVRSEGHRARTVLGEQHARETGALRDGLAHDLHDLVANQIAVAGLHVEAARLQAERLDGDVSELTRSLDRAKQGTEQAHAQLRRLITVLTSADEWSGAEAVDPDAALRALERALPSGRGVRWEPGARAALTGALGRMSAARAGVVLRVVEECVVNATKHGVGEVAVAASVGLGTLALELRNAVAPPAGSVAPGTGIGLRGASSLVRGIGGTYAAGEQGGMWTVTVTVPLVQAGPAAEMAAEPQTAVRQRAGVEGAS